ncbi:trypsin-3-like [Tubulanus polymorphus]|uniref:trypsin-3-like n=1 Tax=Tubulanus polymorphus TaxID=672921 RepID=UPI003DA3D19E
MARYSIGIVLVHAVVVWSVVCLTGGAVSAATVKTKRQGPPPPTTSIDQGCLENDGGVCMPMSLLLSGTPCPFKNNGIKFVGCSKGSVCCYPQQTATTKLYTTTVPPPSNTGATCGISYVDGKGAYRIVGGWNAVKGEWPWMVQIKFWGEQHCGGALIDDQWVVTAAHCFMSSTDPSAYEIVLGEHDRSKPEGTEQVLALEKIVDHKSFNNPSKSNDIALLKLKTPVKYDHFVQKICLPEAKDDFTGTVCTVAGWGSMSGYFVTFPDILQEVNVPMKDHKSCTRLVHPFYDTNVCAGFSYGTQDACGGDSGGPLMCRSPGSKQWKLTGVVSWGDGCALPNKPGVYTKVTEYLKWIEDNKQ